MFHSFGGLVLYGPPCVLQHGNVLARRHDVGQVRLNIILPFFLSLSVAVCPPRRLSTTHSTDFDVASHRSAFIVMI